MGSVGIWGSMIAVMKKNNVPISHFAQALAHACCGLRFPVSSGNGPHDNFRNSHLTNRRMKLRTSKAEWRTDTGGTLTGSCEEGIFASSQFVLDLPAREEQEAGMSVRMIPKSVVGFSNLFSELRIFFNVLTQNEECRGNPIFLQQREQLWSDSGIRSIIKRKCAGTTRARNRPSKQL